MKIKHLLTKTLLVAAGLLVGQSVWAQVSTWTAASGTYTKGQEIKGNTEGIIVMTLGNDDAWTYDSGRGGIVTRTQQSPTLTGGVPTAGGYVTITPVRTLKLSMRTYSSQSNCNVYMYDGTTKIQDFRQKAYNTNDYGKLEAGHTYYIYGGGFKAAGTSTNLEYVFFNNFTATTYETYTIHYVDDSATPVTIKPDRVVSGESLFGATVSAAESDLENITYETNTYAYKSGNTPITLGTSGNEITLVFAKATAANYKIKYKAEISSVLTEIKDEVVVESAVGATVTATGANFPTYITYNTVKYKYSSGNDPLTITGVEEDDVITLTYTPAPIYDYEVNAYDNTPDKLGTITSGSYVEGDDAITVAYPQYYLSGTTLYNIANNGTGDWYRKTFTPDADDYEVQLTYGGASVSDVVYYSEGENLTSVTKINYTNRASNGQVAHTGSAETFVATTTLDAGKYQIFYKALNGSNNESNKVSVVFKSGDQVVYSKNDIGANTNFTANSEEFIVPSDGVALTMACKGHSTAGVDWIYVKRTGDLPSTENIVISAAGKATYVSAYNLDFTGTSIEAYKVKVTAKATATLTKVDEVPAGTPVLLIGTTDDIPVIAGAAAVSDNDLVAGTGATVATTDGEYTNMILNNVGGNVGFYLAADQIVAANRAYLHIPTSYAPDASAPMMLVFDGETTGIADVRGKMEDVRSDFFDLQGRKVAQPAKGLYIQNGRKVILK